MVLPPPKEHPKAPSPKRKRGRPLLVINPTRPKHLRLQNVKKKWKLPFLASEDDLEGKLKCDLPFNKVNTGVVLH
jgi:hypothetical protein